jgi:hypothetical protein
MKNLITVASIDQSQSESLKRHAGKAGITMSSYDHRDKEQTVYIRTIDEADATKLSAWLKANPLEVH